MNAALSKTFVKNRSQGVGSASEANNNSFNNGTTPMSDNNTLNFEYLNNP